MCKLYCSGGHGFEVARKLGAKLGGFKDLNIVEVGLRWHRSASRWRRILPRCRGAVGVAVRVVHVDVVEVAFAVAVVARVQRVRGCRSRVVAMVRAVCRAHASHSHRGDVVLEIESWGVQMSRFLP